MNEAEVNFLAEFIFESDAIEGITDDLAVLKREIQERKSDGHVGAMLLLEYFAGVGCLINEEIVCRVQGLITTEQHKKPGGPFINPRYIGQYRDVPVFVGGREGVKSERISTEMSGWIAKVQLIQNQHVEKTAKINARLIAQSHFAFERIHPFIDGNGRTGRALVYYLLRYMGLTPFVFTDHDKNYTYYRCFDDPDEMEKYFLKRIQLK